MTRAAHWLVGIALSLCACTSDTRTDSGTQVNRDATVEPDAEVDADGGAPAKDASIFVVHDAGGPIPCNVSCDCPQGRACVSGECTSLGTPVWCCDKPGCPGGQQCLDDNDRPGECEGDPGPRDGGTPTDSGPGQVGDYCEADSDCDPALGLSCWERFEAPFIWGYCTLEGCAPACPMGSECIQFNGTPVITGCMEVCNVEADCRSDAFCFPIDGAPFFGVCIPDCRDDFWDCSPRDGSRFCNPATGLFIPDCDVTPSHDNNALIGDPCINSTECATGDICLGEVGWGFDGGMCSHVCSGLPEATACPVGSTCQTLPAPNDAIGMCFRDCVGGSCPERPVSTCGTLDPSWSTPSCLPPAAP